MKAEQLSSIYILTAHSLLYPWKWTQVYDSVFVFYFLSTDELAPLWNWTQTILSLLWSELVSFHAWICKNPLQTWWDTEWKTTFCEKMFLFVLPHIYFSAYFFGREFLIDIRIDRWILFWSPREIHNSHPLVCAPAWNHWKYSDSRYSICVNVGSLGSMESCSLSRPLLN